jgi:hypothetical protein
MKSPVSWIIPLEGHQFDLEDLPHWFAGQDVHVAKRDDEFVLVVPASLIGESYELVRPFAEGQLELINGIGRLLSQPFLPVALTDKLYGLDSAGAIIHTVVAVAGTEMRMKGGTLSVNVAGVFSGDPRDGAAAPFLLAVSSSYRRRDALAIVGRPALTWSEVYLLFELVEAEVGSRMFAFGWIGEADAKLLTRTANSYSALRSEGRHGKDRGDPPLVPMQKPVAVSLVRNLVASWLST